MSVRFHIIKSNLVLIQSCWSFEFRLKKGKYISLIALFDKGFNTVEIIYGYINKIEHTVLSEEVLEFSSILLFTIFHSINIGSDTIREIVSNLCKSGASLMSGFTFERFGRYIF